MAGRSDNPATEPRDDDADEVARQQQIADACVRDGDAAIGRMGLYRRLVRTNLANVARRLLPRTVAALDAGGSDAPGAFVDWFGRFLADASPRTSYLRDVPIEFVAWATPLWRNAPGVAASLGDIARHEIDLFEVETAPRVHPRTVGEVALDRPLVFAAPRKLCHYAYAVHTIAEHSTARTTHVLIHRDDGNDVHTSVIDESKVRLLDLLLGGVPLRPAFDKVANLDMPDVAIWLAELGESGALLGGDGSG